MIAIDDLDVYYYSINLNARFRGLRTREGVILRGEFGWGEFCPFDNYDDVTSARWLRAALETACTPLPEPQRLRIPVNAIIPGTDAADAYRRTQQSGCHTVKVKISDNGNDIQEDIARLQAVRKAVGPAGKIRVDINGLWSVDQAIEFLPILNEAAEGLDYVEQPSPDADDLRRIKEAVDIPLSADEIIRLAPDPFALDLTGIADVAVIKATPLNGISYTRALARHLNMPIIVSSALETSIGMQSPLWLASVVDNLAGACGLGTLSLLEGDLTTTPLHPVEGWTTVQSVEAEVDLLKRYALLQSDRVQWWKERLTRCLDIVNTQHIEGTVSSESYCAEKK